VSAAGKENYVRLANIVFPSGVPNPGGRTSLIGRKSAPHIVVEEICRNKNLENLFGFEVGNIN
jgi:hypothetical protein